MDRKVFNSLTEKLESVKNDWKYDVGEKIVDDSNYIPELNQIQALKGESKTKKYYDSDLGKLSDEERTLILAMRNQGLDIAEKSELAKVVKDYAQDKSNEITSEILAESETLSEGNNNGDMGNNSENVNSDSSSNV